MLIRHTKNESQDPATRTTRNNKERNQKEAADFPTSPAVFDPDDAVDKKNEARANSMSGAIEKSAANAGDEGRKSTAKECSGVEKRASSKTLAELRHEPQPKRASLVAFGCDLSSSSDSTCFDAGASKPTRNQDF